MCSNVLFISRSPEGHSSAGKPTGNEAARVSDLKNRRMNAAVFDKDSPAKFFNKDKAPTPQVLLDWVRDLERR